MKKTIAFIGCGFSAHASLYFLEKYSLGSYPDGVHVLCFDRKSFFGYGISYNTKTEHVLLNRPSAFMSVDYRNRSDFSNWLPSQNLHNHFETRQNFGNYLKNRWDALIERLKAKGFTFEFISEDVIDIQKIQCKYNIITHTDHIYKSDYTILSTGNNHQQNIFNLNGENYLNNLYEDFHKIDKFKKNANILILGSSLSAVDCINYLSHKKYLGTIYCYSRSGLIPNSRNINSREIELTKLASLLQKPKIILRDILHAFQHECSHSSAQLSWKSFIQNRVYLNENSILLDVNQKENVIQSILTSMNGIVEGLWTKLSNNEKRYFILHINRLYMMQRNPMPKESSRLLLKLLQEKQLIALNGSIQTIQNLGQHFRVNMANQDLLVDYIINATGQDRNIAQYPLYKNLLLRKMISENILHGIEVDKNSQHAIQSDGSLDPCFYCIGPKTIGTYITVNSAEMLSKKAESIGSQIANMLNTAYIMAA